MDVRWDVIEVDFSHCFYDLLYEGDGCTGINVNIEIIIGLWRVVECRSSEVID